LNTPANHGSIFIDYKHGKLPAPSDIAEGDPDENHAQSLNYFLLFFSPNASGMDLCWSFPENGTPRKQDLFSICGSQSLDLIANG
jgi:hypothetical protein